MAFLLVDTSFLAANLRLATATQSLWGCNQLQRQTASRALAADLEAGLAACRVPLSDLEGVLVSVGPGSFTGIKIGMAFAAGLKAGRPDLPIRGCSSFELLARHLGSGRIACFLPANATRGFLAIVHDGTPILTAGVVLNESDPLPQAAAVAACDRVFIVGTWPAIEGRLTTHGMSWNTLTPHAAADLAVTGMQQFLATVDWNEPASVLPTPRYLSLTTAEEKRLAERSQKREATT